MNKVDGSLSGMVGQRSSFWNPCSPERSVLIVTDLLPVFEMLPSTSASNEWLSSRNEKYSLGSVIIGSPCGPLLQIPSSLKAEIVCVCVHTCAFVCIYMHKCIYLYIHM